MDDDRRHAGSTGQPQNEAKQGGDLFANLYSDPARLEAFLRAMTGQSLPVAHALARAFPWDKVNTVIDIGTAQGCVQPIIVIGAINAERGIFTSSSKPMPTCCLPLSSFW